MEGYFSSSAQAQEVLGLVASVQAAGGNPLEAVDDYLWTQLVPLVSPSLRYQLYGLSAVLGLCLVFVLVSLAMRLRGQGTFWVIRVSTGGLLTPHWSIGWSLWAVPLLILLQAQIYLTLDYLKREHVVYAYLPMRVFPWACAWMGGWTALWSLTISYCTHRHASGKLQLDARTAIILNSLAVIFPIVYFASCLPFAIKASLTWRRFLDGFAELDALLKAGAAVYDPATFSLLTLAAGLPGLQRFYAVVDELVWDARRVFLVLGISGVVIDSILIVVSYLHLKSLSRVIRESTSIMHTLESSSSREHALLRSYRNLKWTSLSFISIDAVFTGVCFYTAIDTREAFTNGLVLQVDLLMPLYIFAVLGLPTSILLLVRSLDSVNTTTTATSIGVGGKSLGEPHPPVFEMVVPRREYISDGLDEATLKEEEAQRSRQEHRGAPMTKEEEAQLDQALPRLVQRDADGWFRQVQEDAESQQTRFSAGATAGISLQERDSLESSRQESVASTKRHTGRSSLWLSSGGKRWPNRDEQ